MNTQTLARAAVSLAALACTAALAQNPPTVSVDLTKVSGAVAQRIQMDESNMPMSLQVPPEVAAEVCGPQAARSAACVARESSPALDRMIATRMREDDTRTMGAPPAPGVPPAPAAPKK
ncbi:MAG TPA: hypothetical protein VEA40_25505 [Ramlibacter sp.]|nr:hypothetical protein [Ramlibacter sp.]